MAKCSVYYSISTEQTRRNFKDIKRELDRIPGVISVSVNTNTGKLAVDYDNSGTTGDLISRELKKIGVHAEPAGQEEHIM